MGALGFSPPGWRFLVAGDAPLDVTIGFWVEAADYAEITPGLIAN